MLFLMCREILQRGRSFYSVHLKLITSGPNPSFPSFFLSTGYCWMEVQNYSYLGFVFFINRLLSAKA